MAQKKSQSGSGRDMSVSQAGQKGGQRVKQLVEEGKEKEAEQGRS